MKELVDIFSHLIIYAPKGKSGCVAVALPFDITFLEDNGTYGLDCILIDDCFYCTILVTQGNIKSVRQSLVGEKIVGFTVEIFI